MQTVMLVLLFPLSVIFIITVSLILLARNKEDHSYQGNYQRSASYQRLCKSANNRIIAGVCSGIAEYFGWNANVVRLLFIILGVGIIPYIILAIAMPQPDSAI